MLTGIQIREGFIVDDEEEDEEEEQADGSMVLVKKRKKKRRRSNREDEEEEGLDEDDLDLVLENTGHEIDRSSQVRPVQFIIHPTIRVALQTYSYTGFS